MPTVSDLRTALNDAAADTPGLSSTEVLTAGRALRTRRRALTATAATLAAAGLALGVTAGHGASTQGVSSPSSTATTAVVTIDQLFTAGQEHEVEAGVYTRAFTYRSQATVEVSRLTDGKVQPGISTGPTATVQLKGLRVKASDAGDKRLLEWRQNGDNYYLTSDIRDHVSDNELSALVEWISEGH